VLLMSEVVVGAISAALLSGEMFGAREALGTLLIIAAALFEVLGKKPKNATQF
jgi:drug/metabolite transporter (DMT)-like permease